MALTKQSGSPRTAGRFFDDGDKRLIYLGAGSVNDDPPPAYGKGPKSDQVGYAFRTGAKEWRIEFPGTDLNRNWTYWSSNADGSAGDRIGHQCLTRFREMD